MLYQRLVNRMKISRMRKSIATIGAAALVVTLGITTAPTAAATPTCATAAGVETCRGTLANGAGYVFMMPSNFKGTMFFWEHGIRWTYPGVSPVPTGVEQIAPSSVNGKFDISKEMLLAGYGLATYDGTVKGLRGWNNTYRVEMIKEVIDIATAKYPKIQKKVRRHF